MKTAMKLVVALIVLGVAALHAQAPASAQLPWIQGHWAGSMRTSDESTSWRWLNLYANTQSGTQNVIVGWTASLGGFVDCNAPGYLSYMNTAMTGNLTSLKTSQTSPRVTFRVVQPDPQPYWTVEYRFTGIYMPVPGQLYIHMIAGTWARVRVFRFMNVVVEQTGVMGYFQVSKFDATN